MKKINFRLIAFFVVLLSVFSNQLVFADGLIIIRKNGNTGNQPNALFATKSLSTSTTSVIPVTADVVGSDVIVDFTKTVGTAYVSVVDKSGSVVYQTVVDTYSTSEVVIPIDGLSSGSYSLKITYGFTNLIGSFQL